MKKLLSYATLLGVAFVLRAGAQEVLPRPPQPFKGQIGRKASESKPDFPKEITAPPGAPNVLLIMTDDVGFGAASTFGGPIPTPTLDRLAANGLRYNQFHTTALCSPTRAALLTGRNHHSAATGVVMELATGYPGYNSIMPASTGTIGEILRQSGYCTSWYGKNHNTPSWQSSPAGPFDLWPNRLGFDYFYGFMGGETDQWHPALYENANAIEPPHDAKNYHFDADLADHAINWIRTQHALQPEKPFFAYYVPGATHAPHHAPKDWIAKFKGQFDQGWDTGREEILQRQKKLGVVPANTKLTPRPKGIPAWDSLSAEEKKVYARMMEVYAGFLAYTDYNIGRVIDAVEQTGELDNTLIFYIQGDNGASAEGTLRGTVNEVGAMTNGFQEDIGYLLSVIDELGGPTTYNHFPVGWAHAMNTPFQWAKQVASHFGGVRNGLVISWPKRIKDKGGLRTQFHHVIDVAPTILEAAGIQEPAMLNGVAQKPIEGVGLAYSFDDAKAPGHRTTQYFEMGGNRAIYHDGWVAATTPKREPWVTLVEAAPDPDSFDWELYNLAEDFSEANNLAASNPKKLRELQDLFWAEAARYNVLPIDTSAYERAVLPRPSLTRGRNTFTYYPGMIRFPEGTVPDVKNKSYTVTAEVEVPRVGVEGVLVTQGGRFGGWGLLVLDGKPVFVHALSNQAQHKLRIASNEKLAPGKHTIRFEFKYDGGGIGRGGAGTITVDGKQVAQGRFERTIPIRFSLDETFDIGEDTGTPVVEDYLAKMPFKFTGKLEKVTIELAPQATSANDRQKLDTAER